jgi:hypothetical protein
MEGTGRQVGSCLGVQRLENALPEDFAGNRLKLARRQCKAIALEARRQRFHFADLRLGNYTGEKRVLRNSLTLPNALKQSANSRQNLPAAFRLI